MFREELRRGALAILPDIGTNKGAGHFMITDKKPAKAMQAFIAWFSGIVGA